MDRAAGAALLEGRLALFGFDDTPARVSVMARSRAWRVGGAAGVFALFVIVAPFVAVFPPHAVWPIGALLTGSALARRRYVERFTLVELNAVCPKCGEALRSKKGRLKQPHPVPCEGCNHVPALRVPDDALAALAA